MTGRRCPVCASDEITPLFGRKDLLTVYSCGRCLLKFIDHDAFRAHYGEPETLYEKEYFEDGGDLGFKEYRDAPVSNFYWQTALIRLAGEIKGRRVLDIGCGTGRLMGLLARAGAHAEGVEISRYAAGIATSEGLRIVGSDVMGLGDAPAYDIITAFDVIEHFPDPVALLAKVRSLLKDDGVFIFLTPDAGSEKALATGNEWYGYNTSMEHLFYFSREGLASLFEKGFGSQPLLHPVAAPDGEGIIGFVRAKPSPEDDALGALFRSNFSPEHLSERNVIPVCVLLQRLSDPRFLGYAEKYRAHLQAHAGEEEADFLLSFVRKEDHDGQAQGAGRKQGTKEVTIRPYREGDEHGIVSLFKEVFSREMTMEEWRWKYIGQGNRACAVILEDAGTGLIAGHYGGIPLRMLHDGRVIKGIAVGDTMIHPGYRSFIRFKKMQQLFMREMVADSAVLFYGFSPDTVIRLAVERLGIYDRVGPVYEAAKEVSFHNAPARFLYKLFPLDPRDRRVDRLWDTVKHEFRLSAIRDSAFLTWRYAESRLFSYEVWGLRKRWSQRLLAVAVVRKDPSDRLLIMDMVSSRDVLEPLLLKVENLASAMGRRRMALWLPHDYHAFLREKGFAVTDTGATIPTFKHPAVLTKEEIYEKFFYTMGDTDYI